MSLRYPPRQKELGHNKRIYVRKAIDKQVFVGYNSLTNTCSYQVFEI